MFQQFHCYDPCSSYCSPCRSQRKTFFFYFVLFIIYFTSQYCIDSAMHWLESTMGAHVFPIPNPPSTSLPIPSHPSGSSQYTSPEHPVSCIEPGLMIHFTYEFTSFHAIFPYHPALVLSHRVQKAVQYICFSCCLTYKVIIRIFLNSIYMC